MAKENQLATITWIDSLAMVDFVEFWFTGRLEVLEGVIDAAYCKQRRRCLPALVVSDMRRLGDNKAYNLDI